MNKNLFLILLLLSASYLCAQEPVSIHITEKDGLPDIEFYNILEDSKGFIWLASESGLYRYDGKVFTQFSNTDKRGLSVFNLFEDDKGRIWCTNISGQFFYVENNNLITFIDLKEELKGQLANFQIQDDNLLITTYRFLYFINLHTKQKYTKKLCSRGGNRFLKDDNIYMSIGYDSIKLLNKKFNEIRSFSLHNERDSKSKTLKVQGQTLFFKSKKTFFFSQQFQYQNIFKSIDIDTGTISFVKGLEAVRDARIISVKILNSQIWMLTFKGIYVYENDNNNFILKEQILKEEIVTDVIVDKDHNYCVTTLANGVFIIPNIEVFKHNLPEKTNAVMAINKVNDSVVFFGSKVGKVGMLNINTSAYKLSKPLLSKVSAIQYNPDKKYSYVSTDLSSYLLNNKTVRAKVFKGLQGVKSFSRLNKNELLFGTYSKLSLLNERSGLLENYSETKRVYTTYFNANENLIYIGYVDDLVVLDANSRSTIITYNNKEILAISFSQTTDGIIWVGTFKNGLFALKNNNVIRHYGVEDGLLSNRIKYLKADGNMVWISTANGLQEFNSVTNTFKNLTKREGILSFKISGIEILKNRLVVSSDKGIFSFDKDKVFKTYSTPEIYFDEIKINEIPVELTTHYSLDYHQNSIQFGFNVNGILYNKNKTYQYRLLGYNKNWITTSLDVNTIKYTSLPAGEYEFQVRPTHIKGYNKNKFKSIFLNIKLPFWKQWWFVLFYILFIISLIILYYKIKLKNKEKARALEIKQLSLDKELVALKLENLRSQMNPHFIFNALNSIQEYIILNQKKLASEYLGKFADLIRTYLNHSTKGKITLQEEIDCLEMYLELEKLRFEEKLQYAIVTYGILKPDHVIIPTMLVQPYVENALKHGLLHRKSGRILNISFFINEDAHTVNCEIIDNGVGRDKAKEFKAKSHKIHKSFATKATQDRLALLNYGKQKKVGVTITDLFDAKKPSGTQVNIIIPFTKTNL